MSMHNADDEDGTSDVDPTYLALYSQEIDEFRAHLAGRDGQESLPASYLPPNASWSAAEKDAFFRALAVHSRLRPDLIAEEVKTKSVSDVCVYLALLEEATRQVSPQTVCIGAEKNLVDSRIPRRDLPIAVEVSDDWIAREESMATSLAASEPALERQALSQKREEEIYSRRKSIRARKGKARTASNERDREGEKQRRREFEAWLEGAQAKWATEDRWRLLDQVSLSVLDRILREDEEGLAVADQADSPVAESRGVRADHQGSYRSLQGLIDHGRTDGATPGVGEELIDPLLLMISRPPSAASFTSSLEVDRPPNAFTAQAGPSSSTSANPPHAPPTSLYPFSCHFQPSTPPFTPFSHPVEPEPIPALRPSARSTPASENCALADDAEEEVDLSLMSPASRRRCQKRLYMRRKRAQASGGVANESAGRLKAGRKPKLRPPQKDASQAEWQVPAEAFPVASDQASTGPSRGSRDGPSGQQEGIGFRHAKMSGMTMPYKRQAQFASIGIDAQRLHQEGLGLFHLQTVGKMMQMYNRLHDVPPEVASQISVDTLKVLHAIIVQFVAEVMSRAIVSREQERIAKLQTKAWHMRENQNISVANVKHALALYGADSLDKRAHFAGLLKRLALDHSDGAGDEDGTGDEDRTGNEDGAVESNGYNSEETSERPSSPDMLFRAGAAPNRQRAPTDEILNAEHVPQPLSALRMIFPPLFNIPYTGQNEDHEGMIAPDPAAYMPWPSSSLLAVSAEPPLEEDLLPETTDEGALVAELLEDDDIDKDDRAREAEEENALWLRFGGNPAAALVTNASGDAAAGDSAEEKPLVTSASEKPSRKRKRKRRPRGRSKSAVVGNDQGDEHDGVQESTAERRVRRKRGRGTAHLNEDQLRFMEPDPNGRIKSSVYVVDSD
ncbi:hypothetical protein BD414DRAFT_494305 [Trametes punicea]|nr:hypothetical protein BD414DRAFT_494305 [Trametes punicea]